MKKFVSISILVCFLVTGQVGPCPVVCSFGYAIEGTGNIAQEDSLLLGGQRGIFLPTPGVMVHLSPAYTPAYLKGLVIDSKDPFKFHFIIHRNKDLAVSQKQKEYINLVKYFLAALAVPEEDQWVNLSPYEKQRMIPEIFGQTLMGRDLLAEDYMLKQITASLIYPEDNLGKQFWGKVYKEVFLKFGNTNIPVNTFNKVWIVPDRAVVYEKGDTVYIVENHLKVMLEEDYLSLHKHFGITATTTQRQPGDMALAVSPSMLPSDPGLNPKAPQGNNQTHSIASQMIREIVLPAIEKEVNEGKNFATLRQVYSGMLLATWYKRTLRNNILGSLYADKGKIKGIDQDPVNNLAIYNRYLQAFKKGVFNMIREDVDPGTHDIIPRKYFSGGEEGYYRRPIYKIAAIPADEAMRVTENDMVTVQMSEPNTDNAMRADNKVDRGRLRFIAQAAAGVLGLRDQLKAQADQTGSISDADRKKYDDVYPYLEKDKKDQDYTRAKKVFIDGKRSAVFYLSEKFNDEQSPYAVRSIVMELLRSIEGSNEKLSLNDKKLIVDRIAERLKEPLQNSLYVLGLLDLLELLIELQTQQALTLFQVYVSQNEEAVINLIESKDAEIRKNVWQAFALGLKNSLQVENPGDMYPMFIALNTFAGNDESVAGIKSYKQWAAEASGIMEEPLKGIINKDGFNSYLKGDAMVLLAKISPDAAIKELDNPGIANIDDTDIKALASIFDADAELETRAVAALQRIIAAKRSAQDQRQDEQSSSFRSPQSLGTAVLMAMDTAASINVLKQSWTDSSDTHGLIINQLGFLGKIHHRELLEYLMEKSNEYNEWVNFKALILTKDTDFNQLLQQFTLLSGKEDLRLLIVEILGSYEQDLAWKILHDTLQNPNENEPLRKRAAESLSRWAFLIHDDEKKLSFRRAQVEGTFQSVLQEWGREYKDKIPDLYGHVLIEAMRVRPSPGLVKEAGDILLNEGQSDGLHSAAIEALSFPAPEGWEKRMPVDTQTVTESLDLLHRAIKKYHDKPEMVRGILLSMAFLSASYEADGMIEREVSLTLQDMLLSGSEGVRVDLENTLAIMWMRGGFNALDVLGGKFSPLEIEGLENAMRNILHKNGFKLPGDPAMLLRRREALLTFFGSAAWLKAQVAGEENVEIPPEMLIKFDNLFKPLFDSKGKDKDAAKAFLDSMKNSSPEERSFAAVYLARKMIELVQVRSGPVEIVNVTLDLLNEFVKRVVLPAHKHAINVLIAQAIDANDYFLFEFKWYPLSRPIIEYLRAI